MGRWDYRLLAIIIYVLFNESLSITHNEILPHMERFYMDTQHTNMAIVFFLLRNNTALKYKEYNIKRKEKYKQVGHLNQ